MPKVENLPIDLSPSSDDFAVTYDNNSLKVKRATLSSIVTAGGGGGGGSTPAAWGSVTGTLSNQTDLNTALGTKVQVGGDIAGTVSAPLVKTLRPTLGYRWLICGDSNSTGAYSHNSVYIGYETSHLEQLMLLVGRAGFGKRIVNSGFGGTTTKWIIDNWTTQIGQYSPNVLLLQTGTNDPGSTSPTISLAQTVANINTIIDLCKAAGIQLVLFTPPPRGTEPSSTDTYQTNVEQFRLAYRDIAQRRGVIFIDTWNVLGGPTGKKLAAYSSDTIHLNTAGAQAVAKYAFEQLAPYCTTYSFPWPTRDAAQGGNLVNSGTFNTAFAGGSWNLPSGWTVFTSEGNTAVLTSSAIAAGTIPGYAYGQYDDCPNPSKWWSLVFTGITSGFQFKYDITGQTGGDSVEAFARMIYNGLYPASGAQQMGFVFFLTYSGAIFNSYGPYDWPSPFDGVVTSGETNNKATVGASNTATVQFRFLPLDDNIPAGTTGSITAGTTTLTLSTTAGQHADGEILNVPGAGAAGATLAATVVSRSGANFTISPAASTTVSNAAITMNKVAPHSGSAYIAGVSYLNYTTMQGGNSAAVGLYRGN